MYALRKQSKIIARKRVQRSDGPGSTLCQDVEAVSASCDKLTVLLWS